MAEVRREGGRYVAVVDGQPVDSATNLRSAYETLASAVRRRLPRGRPRTWGVEWRCNTGGFGLVYGNRSRGGGGGGELNPCLQAALDEANRLGRPILVLKQDVELEPEQGAFVERVAGGWVGGRHWATFDDENDVLTVAVEALSALNTGQRRAELAPAAQERAGTLAAGERRYGYSGHRSAARVALVPLVATPILDALALDEALGDAIADLARGARLVPHSVGIAAKVSRVGVSLERAGGGYVGEAGLITVAVDGAMVCEVDVGGDGQLAGTRVDSLLLARGIQNVGAFALSVWNRIDHREEVQQVAVAVAILDAQHKVFDLAPDARSYSMGTSLPGTIVIPEPPVLVRRAEVSGNQLSKRLVAEVRRVFADAGATAH